MTFRVGQKVVRVASAGGDIWARGATFSAPKLGEICTIRTINDWPNKTLLTFDEHNNSHLINRWDVSGMEPGFNAVVFRPIVERKTDISIFTKMLTGKRVDA